MTATREHYDELLSELDGRVLALGDLVARAINTCIDALARPDLVGARAVIDEDSDIDQQRYLIEKDALLLIATQQPLAGDLRRLAAVMAIATELERIGDYCEGVATLAIRLGDEPLPDRYDEIRAMAKLTENLLRQVLAAYRDRDLEAAGDVWRRDDEVDDLYERVVRHMLTQMLEEPTTIRINTYLLWVAHNVERMSDRVGNLAERVAFVVTGNAAAFYEGR